MVREGSRPFAIALAVVAGGLAVSLPIAPKLPEGPLVTPLGAFVGATVLAIASLGIASRALPEKPVRIGAIVVSALVLVLFAIVPPRSRWLGVPIDLALVALAYAVGGWIGARVQHPGHMLPAAVVASAGDLVSVFHPQGPSNAIAASERALSLLAFSFPAPGDGAMAPSIGFGDLAFVAILLGVASQFEIAAWRVVLLALVGALLAGVASALTAAPFPALPTIGAAVVLGVPAMRTLRPRDRTVAIASMVIAVTAAGALIVTARL